MTTDDDKRRMSAIADLRTYRGTPFRHQGRRKGHGIDCIGIALAAARLIGAITPEEEKGFPAYGRLPFRDSRNLRNLISTRMRIIPIPDVKPLDIALMTIYGLPMHLGVIADFAAHGGVNAPHSIIHAMATFGSVQEHFFDPPRLAVRNCYRFLGLD